MTVTLIWIAVALVAIGLYLSWTAGRLDRLHARIDAARAALDAQLLRRASVTQELATSGVLDPAASIVLYEAAHAARQAEEEHREVAESELSQALRAVFGEPAQVDAVREAPGGVEAAEELAAGGAPGADGAALPQRRGTGRAGAAQAPHGALVPAGRPRPVPARLRDGRRATDGAGRPAGQLISESGGAGRAWRRTIHRLSHWPLMWTGPPGFSRGSRIPSSPSEVAPCPARLPAPPSPTAPPIGTARVKRGMAEQLKGGVIMDVVNAEQAKIAEDAGAVAVMALERVPADIRKDGGVARMSDPNMIEEIIGAVSIPVMAKSRIGHFVEAQVLQSLGVDYIDESEVLTPADEVNHSDKFAFTTPFVCGATNLGEALRRIAEGAAMIRSKGEAGTGNVVEAVRHLRQIKNEIAKLRGFDNNELYAAAKELRAPYELVKEVSELGKLPVVLFSAGGVATPADAALMRQLGAEGVFVGSGIFKSGDPAKRAAAIVKATTFYDDPKIIADASRNLGEAMVGINCDTLPETERYANRGW